MTEKDKMLAGELYLATDPELSAARARARRLLRAYNQTTEDELPRRGELLAELLGEVGAGTWSSRRSSATTARTSGSASASS